MSEEKKQIEKQLTDLFDENGLRVTKQLGASGNQPEYLIYTPNSDVSGKLTGLLNALSINNHGTPNVGPDAFAEPPNTIHVKGQFDELERIVGSERLDEKQPPTGFASKYSGRGLLAGNEGRRGP